MHKTKVKTSNIHKKAKNLKKKRAITEAHTTLR